MPAMGIERRIVSTDHRIVASVTEYGNTYEVSKIRRDNFALLTWIGDHSPRHVHIYRDGKLVLKWNLDD